MTALRRERDLAGATERLPESREDHEVGVQPDALNPSDAKGCEAVIVLQPSELSLHGCPSPVEDLPFVRSERDREQRDRASLAERDDGNAAVAHAVVVVSAIHRARLRGEAASLDRIEQRGDVERFVTSSRLDVPQGKVGAGAHGHVELVP